MQWCEICGEEYHEGVRHYHGPDIEYIYSDDVVAIKKSSMSPEDRMERMQIIEAEMEKLSLEYKRHVRWLKDHYARLQERNM